VALRWYVQAPDSGPAIALLAGNEPLVAPDLVVAEVTNAAWKLVRAGEIGGEHGARIAAAVPAAFSALIGAARLSARAFALAHELDHPVYDCLYLALAEVEDARMITADQRLLTRLRGSAWQELARPLVSGV
jgi:predicted nucleic acid-binding protein